MAQLTDVVVDAAHPSALARFWAEALAGFSVRPYDQAEIERLAALGLTPETDTSVMLDGPRLSICFQLIDDGAAVPKNKLHLELRADDWRAEVLRLTALGATVRQEFDAHAWLRDPEGNDFCVVEGGGRDVFTTDDLDELTACVAASWTAGAERDWSQPAGTLEWSCGKTAAHAIDTVLAPAFFLASRRQDAYPDGGWSPPEDAPPAAMVQGLWTASRILRAVVHDAEPGVRAVILRRPAILTTGPKDFVPRGALELALHAHDVCTGLDVAFTPPPGGMDRLRRHTARWPFWGGGWGELSLEGDPWEDLLRASGRVAD